MVDDMVHQISVWRHHGAMGDDRFQYGGIMVLWWMIWFIRFQYGGIMGLWWMIWFIRFQYGGIMVLWWMICFIRFQYGGIMVLWWMIGSSDFSMEASWCYGG